MTVPTTPPLGHRASIPAADGNLTRNSGLGPALTQWQDVGGETLS
jgi:hypothetical protein